MWKFNILTFVLKWLSHCYFQHLVPCFSSRVTSIKDIACDVLSEMTMKMQNKMRRTSSNLFLFLNIHAPTRSNGTQMRMTSRVRDKQACFQTCFSYRRLSFAVKIECVSIKDVSSGRWGSDHSPPQATAPGRNEFLQARMRPPGRGQDHSPSRSLRSPRSQETWEGSPFHPLSALLAF